MQAPKIAPTLSSMTYPALAKKLASVIAFYKKYPNNGVQEVKADDKASGTKKS